MNAVDYFFQNSSKLNKDLVLGPKETISYSEMYKNTLNLASYLHREFGERNNIILISHNSVYFITAYLAIMKSGNVCLI